MTSKYNDNYWYDENKIIIKKIKKSLSKFFTNRLDKTEDFLKK